MHTHNDSPLLGRCKEKGCDYVLFATRDQVQQADNFKEVKAGAGVFRVGNNGHFARCTNGHRFFPLKAIKGTYSKDHKCDARCLNAKGNDCTCSCGGMNHGRGYAVEVQTGPVIVTASVESDMASEKQERFIGKLLLEKQIPANDIATGDERRKDALAKLDAHVFTKRQASKTIEWLLTLPKKEA